MLLAKCCRYIYKKIERKRLQVSDFTIVTNSCVGGVIYNNLGVKFQSPLINIGLHDVDFYKFLNNLHHYLKCELRFVQGIASWPTAYLDDILLDFIHYENEKVAAEKWYERCKRINWEKIYIICSDRPSGDRIVTYEDMASLKNIKCANKVIFSTRDYDDIDYIVKLPKDKDGDFVNVYMLDKMPIIKFWRWELKWDYVKWLNDGAKN